MPVLVALMKIPHQPSVLTNHLQDMRRCMPAHHRAFIEWVEALPEFRRFHYGWANEYINKRTDDPRGTGGTPYMQWLQQLITETFKLS